MAGRVGASAEKKFWKMPELVTKLVSFLDGQSTLVLAQAHQLTLEVVQQPFVWNQLVRRSYPYSDWPVEEADVLRKRAEVMVLVQILKLAGDEKSRQLELELLGVICERFPPDPNDHRHWDEEEMDNLQLVSI